MIGWLRRMMGDGGGRKVDGVTDEDRAHLHEIEDRQKRLLTRADKAIAAGMKEAGRVFLPYTGPERRKAHR